MMMLFDKYLITLFSSLKLLSQSHQLTMSMSLPTTVGFIAIVDERGKLAGFQRDAGGGMGSRTVIRRHTPAQGAF